MRVMILSMPRCGTSVLSTRISKIARIPNLVEPFNDPKLGFNPALSNYNPKIDPADWLELYPTFVFKILGINLQYTPVQQLVERVKFTDIIVLHRRNLADCCISLSLAEQTGNYHYASAPTNIDTFTVAESDVKRWCLQYQLFKEVVSYLKSSHYPIQEVCYDKLVNGESIHLSAAEVSVPVGTRTPKMEASCINYRAACANYDEVTEWIKQWTN